MKNHPSLFTQISDIQFDNCIMNASGAWCTTEKELESLESSVAATLVSKSATLDFRSGNPEPRYVELQLGSINSMGLPNLGIDFYLQNAIERQRRTSKKQFISVAGLSMDENLEILKIIQKSEFEGCIELNLSCPNIAGKPQTGYDFDRTKEVLDHVFTFYTKPLGVKLPPYFDMVHFELMATILNQFPLKFVTCINSIGNALFVDIQEERVVIKPKDGFGGIGGAYIKPTALANVRMFYNLLRKDISVIGCGGIENGKDAFEHILCGASMLQIGTQLMKEGTGCFQRILDELSEIMVEKGYSNLNDFKGKLKSFD